MPSVTIEIIITIGAKFSKKALKSKCLFADPIIMFGGSPINVAVPPIFENNTLKVNKE